MLTVGLASENANLQLVGDKKPGSFMVCSEKGKTYNKS